VLVHRLAMAGRLRRDSAPDARSSRNPGIRAAGDILEAARDLARRLEEDARAAAARCFADAESAARERSLELEAREFEIRRMQEETERQRSEVLELRPQ
jgi:cell division septum initiation protein DivIVA